MSPEPAISLYDISSTLNPQAWSPNTWKARLVLNYKRIPYKTIWLSYPDIEPTLVKLGCPPTGTKYYDPSKPHYTLPIIVDTSSGTPVVVADSLAIAEYLDAKYPEYPVFPNPGQGKALQYAFEEFFNGNAGRQVGNLVIPHVWKILDDRGKVYFRQTRERRFGKKLEEICPEGPIREAQWKALQKGWDDVATILEKNGPDVDFVAGGNSPTWVDIVMISDLLWVKIVLPDEWERVKHWNGGRWQRLLDKTEEWMKVH